MKVYVATSWRNDEQPEIVKYVRELGHEVYDFRHPRPGNNGFSWGDIAEEWQSWDPQKYIEGLKDPIAEAGYKSDIDAMEWADVFIGVQPFGRSASMEMGWAAGRGKPTILLVRSGEPELMVKMFTFLIFDRSKIYDCLEEIF